MKKSELFEIANSRQNLIGFLHFTEKQEIKDITGVDVNGMSYDEAVSAIFAAELTPRKREKAVMILVESNNQLKTERFRYEFGLVYAWSVEHGAYLCSHESSYKDFKKLVKKHGEYI